MLRGVTWFKTVNLLLCLLLVDSRGETHIDWSLYKPRVCLNDDNYTYFSRDAIEVYVGLVVREIYDIKEDKMEYGMQIYFLEFWTDPGLQFDRMNISKAHRLPPHIIKCIWTPDSVFYNSKEAILYDVSAVNRDYKVFPRGLLYRLSRYRVTLSCQMDFRKYPLDTQTCDILMGFMSSKSTEALMRWLGEDGTPKALVKLPAVTFVGEVRPLQFALCFPPKMESFNISLLTGKASLLRCSFQFRRNIAALFINTYIPSLLVVCLSFVSFWLDITAIPGRVTLGVTALLTLATQIAHARSSLPAVNYMTAMDVWLFGCLLMVFCSLLEFTLAQSINRRQSRVHVKSKPQSPQLSTIRGGKRLALFGVKEKMNHQSEPVPGVTLKDVTRNCVGLDNKLDRTSRILFPGAVICFSVVYTLYYGFRENKHMSYEYAHNKFPFK